MIIPKETVGEVVQEASRKMSDPNFSAVLVGGFVQEQKATAQYLSSYADEVGGAENVVSMIFHASLLGLMFQRGYGRTPRALHFDDLDHASAGDRKQRLAEQQPYVLEYIESNVENAPMRESLMLVALAMESVS